MVETEFKDNPTAPDHEAVATAVFAQPEIGTVGLSETAAAAKFAKVDVYKATFRPMKHTLSGRDENALMKIVVDGDSDRVLGVHVLGDSAAEIVQSVAIAVKMGATKADFDRDYGGASDRGRRIGDDVPAELSAQARQARRLNFSLHGSASRRFAATGTLCVPCGKSRNARSDRQPPAA